MINHARLLHRWAAAGKDNEVWNALYLEAACQLWIAFCVNFNHDGPAGHVCCRARYLGSGQPAGPAPRRPEVCQHRDPSLPNDFVERLGINFQWLIYRRQRSFACAAVACISQMFLRDTVFLPTILTGSNHWHSLLTIPCHTMLTLRPEAQVTNRRPVLCTVTALVCCDTLTGSGFAL